MTQEAAPDRRKLVLGLLCATQFLMVLDSTVMNVSIAQLVDDLDTTVVGIQAAITLFTLVMASTMIIGGKLGDLWGRRAAFRVGLVVYAVGSGITALSGNVQMLYLGWSLLEGLGAALILPTLAALVASNFDSHDRPMAYGLIAAAAAVAVASGPLIGGAATTFASWRYVFAGEVVVCIVILAFTRVIAAPPPGERLAFDGLGAVLSVTGMASIVMGVLLSSSWGWVEPSAGAPSLLGISGTLWLICGGVFVLWLFVAWQQRRHATGREPLVDPELFENRPMMGGNVMMAMQQFILAGAMFAMPLFLSITLGLSAFATGLVLMPLSLGLIWSSTWLVSKLLGADKGPRYIVRAGLVTTLVAVLLLFAGMSKPDAEAPDLLLGLFVMGIGMGLLAGQIANVIQSSVRPEQSSQAGGLQYTSQNLGASLGTALVGSVLIGTLATSAIAGIDASPAFSAAQKTQAGTRVSANATFVSDAELERAMEGTALTQEQKEAAFSINADARIKALRRGMSVVALFTLAALLFSSILPQRIPGKVATT